MRVDDPNELLLHILGLTISAKGILAICVMAVPVALVLAAIAWRIAKG